jgi:hypothetical protein
MVDLVRVGLVTGQAPADFADRAEHLAHAFGAAIDKHVQGQKQDNDEEDGGGAAGVLAPRVNGTLMAREIEKALERSKPRFRMCS